MTSLTSASAPEAGEIPRIVLRHSALVRACHWINALCFLILLMSGLQIFNAHPALTGAQRPISNTRCSPFRRAKTTAAPLPAA